MTCPCSKCGNPVAFISELDQENHVELFGRILCLSCRVVKE